MALTKEDLDNIKLPLSDEDYKMLREEDARSCYKIWQLASLELRDAFDKKEAELTQVKSQKKKRKKSLLRDALETISHMTTGIIIDDEDWEDLN